MADCIAAIEQHLGRPVSRIFHSPSELVVNQWACDGESGLHRDILCRHDVWTMLHRQISWKITYALSMLWHFTTKSGGIWVCIVPCLVRGL
jgi:hypothetical protein